MHSTGKNIQTYGHCSVEDARTTMCVFKVAQRQWELEHGITNISDGTDGDACDSGYSSATETSSFLCDEFWPEELSVNY